MHILFLAQCDGLESSVNIKYKTGFVEVRIWTMQYFITSTHVLIIVQVLKLLKNWNFYAYLQYIPGHKYSNIILTAPHGGLTEEDSIPLRMAGCKGTKGKKGVSSDGCVYKVQNSN